jgi:hypothetical protein
VAGYVDVRRAVVRGFPDVVFYRHRPERIDVLRVLHAARLTQGYSDLRPGHGDHERSPDRRSGHLFRVVSQPGAER